jgi:hypothetical protein
MAGGDNEPEEPTERFDVLVPVQLCLEPAPGVAGTVDDQHPAAAEPEVAAVPEQ